VRRAGSGLIRVDDELIVVLMGEHLVGRLNDGIGSLRIEPARLFVRQRRCLLDPNLRSNERPQRA
jgi:hypothetical protein